MKLKSLAVITLLLLGCSAAFGQTYAFGFLSAGGVGEYCNYELYFTGGDADFYLEGYDVLEACPFSPIPASSIEGFKIQVPDAAFSPVYQGAEVYADQIYDAYCLCWSEEQWTVLTKNKPSKLRFGNYSWAGYVGFFGFEFLGNYGFLTNTIPTANGPVKTTGTTTITGLTKEAVQKNPCNPTQQTCSGGR